MNRVEYALAHATETKALRIGAGILPQTGELFKELFPGCRAIIVADPTTFRVAGEDVQKALPRPASPKTHLISSPLPTCMRNGPMSKSSTLS